MTEKPPRRRPRFYVLRTTAGQEYNVAVMVRNRIMGGKYKVYSIVVVPGLKGMVIVEADAPYEAQRAAYGLKHFKGLVRGAISLEDVEKMIKPKPMIEQINVGDIVEIIRGPFTGMKGRVVEVDKSRNEIRVEIVEAAFLLPAIINAEDVKIVQRAKQQKEEEE